MESDIARRLLVGVLLVLMFSLRSSCLLSSRGLHLARRAYHATPSILSAAESSGTDAPHPKGRTSASVVQAEKGAATVEMPLHPPRVRLELPNTANPTPSLLITFSQSWNRARETFTPKSNA